MVEGGREREREACQSLPSAEQEDLQRVAVILSTVLHCHQLHKETRKTDHLLEFCKLLDAFSLHLVMIIY